MFGILGGSIRTLKENAEVLVAATRVIGLEVSADKTKYMVMSRDQNAGRIHRVRIDNSTLESVEEFKYLGTTLKLKLNSVVLVRTRILLRKKLEQIEVRKCLLSFGAESFVFQVAIQKFKDQIIYNYNFVCCFVWV